ncbi:MAG TPA: hypothetical protein VN088_08500 [Nocardioides sp.]|nr:hypothetical protein [Nocardioides sp.]
MATRISVAAQNAAADAIGALLNAGTIEIRSGAQPATVGTAATGILLGTLTLSATAFGASSAGTAAANAITGDSSADATGTAGWFRAKASGGTGVIDGSVTATGGGGDMTLDSVSIVVGGTINVTSWTITMPSQ